MSVLEQLDNAITALAAVRDELAKDSTAGVNPADGPAPATGEPDAQQVAGGDRHDNTLPFKCPACGQTYAEQIECTNGHPAEQTLPTEQVLGATGAAGADGSDASSSSSSTATPSAETTTPAGPTWPA